MKVPLVHTSLREVTVQRYGKGLKRVSLPSQHKACVQQKRPKQKSTFHFRAMPSEVSRLLLFSREVVSHALRHGLRHARPPSWSTVCGGEGLVELNEAMSHAV